MGYTKDMIVSALEIYPHAITKDIVNDVIIWTVQEMGKKMKNEE